MDLLTCLSSFRQALHLIFYIFAVYMHCMLDKRFSLKTVQLCRMVAHLELGLQLASREAKAHRRGL